MVNLPADVDAKLQQAVDDRDHANQADQDHAAAVRALQVSTSAEIAAKDALIDAQQVAINAQQVAIAALTTFLQTDAEAPPPSPPPQPTSPASSS